MLNATPIRAMSETIITVLRDQRSTNAPASGAKIVKGKSRAISRMVVTSGAALETMRTRPNAAMKLNQLPSSEITCPHHNRLKERLLRRSCMYVSEAIIHRRLWIFSLIFWLVLGLWLLIQLHFLLFFPACHFSLISH